MILTSGPLGNHLVLVLPRHQTVFMPMEVERLNQPSEAKAAGFQIAADASAAASGSGVREQVNDESSGPA